MKELLKLSAFPAAAVLLLFLATSLDADAFKLWWSGTKAPGTVAGMLVVRPGQVDLIDDIATSVVFEMSDGRRLKADFHNRRLLTNEATSPAIDPEIAALMTEAIQGNATSIRWLLQRERRKEGGTAHVTRVEIFEKASGKFALPAVPAAIVVGANDRLNPAGTSDESMPAVGVAGEVTTKAIFDARDAARLRESNGETLVEYEQQRLGKATSPSAKDFFLFSEPYATEFRPIFTYPAGGRRLAGVSDVGRQGGPTLAVRLFEPCWAFYDRDEPQRATLVAEAGKARGDLLNWFSRYCEGLFSQWGMPLLIAFAAAMFGLVGVMVISLRLLPPKRQTHLADSTAAA